MNIRTYEYSGRDRVQAETVDEEEEDEGEEAGKKSRNIYNTYIL